MIEVGFPAGSPRDVTREAVNSTRLTAGRLVCSARYEDRNGAGHQIWFVEPRPVLWSGHGMVAPESDFRDSVNESPK
jgi:hypothetical protein